LSAYPSDYILHKYGGIEAIKKQVDTSRVLLAKTVLTQIAKGDKSAKAELSIPQLTEMQNALQIVELRALDLMHDWKHDSNSLEGQEFKKTCSFAFDLRRSLPEPSDPDEALKSCLMLACMAVLGDRTADIRRFFSERPWTIPDASESPAGWAQRLFYTTADAFLRLVRKQGWADLEAVAEAINKLREQQQSLEPEYLKQENSVRQVAALELVSFYHLAKAVDVLGVYIGKGEPASAIDEVDFHMNRAIRAADTAGIVELALLLRWMAAAARATGRRYGSCVISIG